MAKISFYELLGISDKATPEEIQTAFEQACTVLEGQSDSEERRNRLVFLKHARDNLLDGRKRALHDRDNRQFVSPPVLASKSGSGWWLAGIAGVVAGYMLAWWMDKPIAAPVSSAAMSSDLGKGALVAQAVNTAVPSIEPHPTASMNSRNKADARPARLRELASSNVTMFDIKDEAYRIANMGGVRLLDIQFDADAKRATNVAWAMPTLERKERYCSIRIARAYGQDRLLSGEQVTAYESTRYKAILAHELSHCVDWYETGSMGWRTYGSGILQPRDLAPTDAPSRWKEEFADLYAIHLLKLAYGDDVAMDAAQIIAFERKGNNHPSYRHSWIPLERGNPLGINDPADANAIIVKYWTQ